MQNTVHPFMRRSLCALHRMTMDELVNYRKAQRTYAVQADAPLAAWENASRADIPDGYADTFVNSRLSEWPRYSVELLSRRLRKPAGQVTYTEAFEHLNHLRPSRENAFLIRTREGDMWK